MIYNLSKSTPSRIRFYKKNVHPHSLGADTIHLKFSGKMAATFIFGLFSHDCRLTSTPISKLYPPLIGETRPGVFSETRPGVFV